MTRHDTMMETLNAYVDGELSGAQAASLVHLLAHDPQLAEQVAALTRLKAAVQDSMADVPRIAPDMDAIYRAHPKRRRRGWFGRLGARPRQDPRSTAAMAAALAVVSLIGAWLLLAHGPRSPIIAEAIAQHQNWAREKIAPAAAAAAKLAAFDPLAHDFYVPDLSASKLTITAINPFAQGGLHVGYTGTRNCHLSLFIEPGTALKSARFTEAMVGRARASAVASSTSSRGQACSEPRYHPPSHAWPLPPRQIRRTSSRASTRR